MHVNNITSLPCKWAIDLQTQIKKTVIDIIYFNDFNKQTASGIIIRDLSYHNSTFILTSKYKIHCKKSNHPSIQNMSNFNVEIFLSDLTKKKKKIKFLLYSSLYRLGVTSWRSPSRQLTRKVAWVASHVSCDKKG